MTLQTTRSFEVSLSPDLLRWASTVHVGLNSSTFCHVLIYVPSIPNITAAGHSTPTAASFNVNILNHYCIQGYGYCTRHT